MILTHKTVTNCYHKFAQVEGVSSIPSSASRTKSSKKRKNQPENQRNTLKTSELSKKSYEFPETFKPLPKPA